MPSAHLQGYICCALMRGHPVKIKAQWNNIFILLPKTSVAYVIWQLCEIASIKKIKLWAKVIPAERVACKILSSNISNAMAAICVRCLLQTGEIALQNKAGPVRNPLSASTSLMVSISCLMTSSFFSFSWRNFATEKPSELKQTSWHRDSAGSWGSKSTCSTFPCSSCMFLRRVSMGASASAKSCWILIWRRKVAKKLDSRLVWIVAERNRTLHQKYKFPEGLLEMRK